MKKAFCTIILSAGILSLPAQVKCNISKAYAYFTVSMPGMQMVDEKGNPIDPVPQVERFIYLECNGAKAPEIRAVYYNNVSLRVTATKVDGITVTVGKKPENEKEILIKAKKGNTFYRLDLQPADGKPQSASACKNIIIHLKIAGKLCTYKITGGESQLYSLPRY